MRTYVISLEEPDTDLMQMLRNNTLDPIWVPGVNANRLTENQLQSAATPLYARIGPLSSIGIALAHMRAWRTMIRNNDRFALIVEDDVVLADDFRARLPDALRAMPTDTDVLALGCFGCTTRVNPFSIGFWLTGDLRDWSKFRDVDAHIVEPHVSIGAHAYVVTRAGAQKLLTLFDGRIRNQVDAQMLDLSRSDDLRYYALRDRIAYQTSTDSSLRGSSSANKSSAFPIVLTESLKTIHVDEYFTADYPWNLSLLRIGSITVPVGAIVSMALAMLLCAGGVPAWSVLLAVLVIGAPDILLANWEGVMLYVVAVGIGGAIGAFIYHNPRPKRVLKVYDQ